MTFIWCSAPMAGLSALFLYISLFVSLFLSFLFFLFICLSLFLFPFFSLSLFPSFCLPLSLSCWQSNYLKFITSHIWHLCQFSGTSACRGRRLSSRPGSRFPLQSTSSPLLWTSKQVPLHNTPISSYDTVKGYCRILNLCHMNDEGLCSLFTC